MQVADQEAQLVTRRRELALAEARLVEAQQAEERACEAAAVHEERKQQLETQVCTQVCAVYVRVVCMTWFAGGYPGALVCVRCMHVS